MRDEEKIKGYVDVVASKINERTLEQIRYVSTSPINNRINHTHMYYTTIITLMYDCLHMSIDNYDYIHICNTFV
jgi:hypothetical protein